MFESVLTIGSIRGNPNCGITIGKFILCSVVKNGQFGETKN